MTSRAELAAAVAQLTARELLPPRRADDGGLPEGAGVLLDVCPLCPHGPDDVGPGPWVAVVELSDGSVVGAPLVGNGSSASGVRRAVPGDGVSTALVERLAASTGATIAMIGPFSMSGVEAEPALPDGPSSERGFEVDQTHDSVVVSEAVVVKWGVDLARQVGIPPAVQLLRQLSAAGFTELPEPRGHLVWRDLRGAPAGSPPQLALVASAARFLPGAEDGWDWYVDDLLDHLDGRLDLDRSLAPATALGGLVARFHVALATPTRWQPVPVESSAPSDAMRWLGDALARLDEAVEVTSGPPGERLADLAPKARTALDALLAVTATPLTLVHGDLHVGQVLRWSGGYALNDFDGNPVVSSDQQRAAQPPARDVAGMLQSLDHVGRIASRRTAHRQDVEVEVWIGQAKEGFLAAYRGQLDAAGLPGLLDERLIAPFSVEQECREYVYAARHLPSWVRVPDAALPALLRAEA